MTPKLSRTDPANNKHSVHNNESKQEGQHTQHPVSTYAACLCSAVTTVNPCCLSLLQAEGFVSWST